MAARRASSLWRGVIVALGCISAVWMIFTNCDKVASYIKSFLANNWNFFEYFLSKRLVAFAALFLGISFFAIIIRDLWALKKPLLWITLVFSVLCFLVMAINLFVSPIPLHTSGSFIVLFEYISLMLLMVAYTVFAIVGINSRRYQPFAFFFGVFCALLVLIYNVIIITGNNSSPDFSLFVPHITVFAANLFVFKCTLYEK